MLKAFLPIEIAYDGIVIFFNDGIVKELLPIDTDCFGKSTNSSKSHDRKAEDPIETVAHRKRIEDNLTQFKKALSPIDITFVGITM